MEVRHLASLIAIAEHGSFSAAARHLKTVQSNVSAHISRLEKELGVTLVDRHSGKVTDEGAVVVERGRRIIHELQDIEADIHSTDLAIEGESRMGCLSTTGRWLIPAMLPLAHAMHPKLRITVVEGGTLNLVPRLISGDLDAAIVHFPIADPELNVDPLFSEEIVLLAHPKFSWAARDTITLAELANHQLLLAPRNTELRRIIEKTAASRKVALRAQAEIDGVRLLSSLAIDGFGPTLVPSTAVPRIAAENLHVVQIPELPRRLVGWATKRRPLPNKATRALHGIVRTAVQQAGVHQHGVNIASELLLPGRRTATEQ
jgi:LysR family hydrogen peroxide-inducible transcriptional activator